jgi:NAD(P)-dependent dehydrogenase (short-subunit alcohol dehydrogenase family)
MDGRVCMITGANSGIGRATALGLAEMGASVVMVCRSRERGEEALAEVKAATGSPTIELLLADLSSQSEVRRLAEDLRARFSHLHVLINNAGTSLSKQALTVDGFETISFLTLGRRNSVGRSLQCCVKTIGANR